MVARSSGVDEIAERLERAGVDRLVKKPQTGGKVAREQSGVSHTRLAHGTRRRNVAGARALNKRRYKWRGSVARRVHERGAAARVGEIRVSAEVQQLADHEP
eukprot:Amastigsp_a183431_23.p5 type:complete len:102 gc:universal Amastigsp_a183431_23:1036-1341(+)